MKEDNECRIPTPENCSTFAVTVRVEKPKILKAAKEKVAKILEGCNATCTLGHLLSGCAKSLDRYTFRHNSLLIHRLDAINKRKKERVKVFADLKGWRTNA